MSNKKIFIYFSVIPILFAQLNKVLTSISFMPWLHDRINEIGFIALTIAGLNCFYIIYKNAKTKEHSRFWYWFSAVMAAVFFGYLYLGYTLTTAGF